VAAYLVVVGIALSLLVLLVWGLHRLAVAAGRSPGPRRAVRRPVARPRPLTPAGGPA
jgi:hypothetical protein